MLNEILFGEVTRVEGSMGLPELSLSVNVMVGALPAAPLSTFTRLITMPGAVADSWGRMCAPWMDASSSSSPLGMWHWRALVVVELGKVHVIGAGGEVDVVVAGAAGGAAGVGVPGGGLCGAGGGFVALRAAARIGGQNHGGPIGGADGVLPAGDDAREAGCPCESCGPSLSYPRSGRRWIHWSAAGGT